MRKEIRALFLALTLTAASGGAVRAAAGASQEGRHQRSEEKYRERLTKEVRHQLVISRFAWTETR